MSKAGVNREIEKIYDRLAEVEMRSKLWYMGTEIPIDDAIRLLLDHFELDMVGPSVKKREAIEGNWRVGMTRVKKAKKSKKGKK